MRLPGRESRLAEASYENWAPLVADASAALRPLLDLPVVLFGHSFGAMLAYELACELERQGRGADLALVVSACRGPGRPARFPEPHDGSSAQLWSWVRALNATPSDIIDDPAMRAALEPALRADLKLAQAWSERRPERIALPITAFRGALDLLVSGPDVRAWEACTSKRYRSVEFEGDHFFINCLEAAVVGALAGLCEAA